MKIEQVKTFINKYMKRGSFIADFAHSIAYGFNHRWAGIGTSKADKKNVELTQDDLERMSAAWQDFKQEGDKVFEGIEPHTENDTE